MPTEGTPCLRRFLLVEDNDDHAKIIERSLRTEQIPNILIRVKDGVEAIRYLNNEGEYSAAPRPDVVLLDLKLPKKDGHEVLMEIKKNSSLKMIPVVVLTTSDADADKMKAYEHNANSYLVKPLESGSFRKMVQDLGLYWGAWNKSARFY